jgi:hypothetical protein
MIRVKLDTAQLQNAQRVLQTMGKHARPILARSINRAIRGVVTDATNQARQTYTVKAGAVRNSFKKEWASKKRLQGQAVSKGSPLRLYHFAPRPKKPSNLKHGVSVSPKGVRWRIPGTFIAPMKKGGRQAGKTVGYGIFKRAGKDRYPLEQQYGPSIPQMVDNEDVQDAVEKGAQERLSKNLEHEVDRHLQKVGLKK